MEVSLNEQAAGLAETRPEYNPITRFALRELCDTVQQAIEQHPADEATVVRTWMNGCHGERSMEKVAGTLGIPTSRAYKLMDRAFQQLARLLSEYRD